MELTVIQRLSVLVVLPPQGSLITLRVVKDLRSDLGFSEEELAELQFEETERGTTWNDTRLVKDVEVGPAARKVVLKALADLDKAEKLRLEHVEIADLFGYEPGE